MPNLSRKVGGSRNIFSDITEPIGASARTGARALAPSSAKPSFSRTVQPQLARAHVAEPEQTHDEFGIKRAATGVQLLEARNA
jgi:hypothetical protein